jgi:hypothetical protein
MLIFPQIGSGLGELAGKSGFGIAQLPSLVLRSLTASLLITSAYIGSSLVSV